MPARNGGRQTVITPFWNRMPRFFLYALTPPALYILFLLAIVNTLTVDLARGGSVLFAGAISLAATFFAVKYGYDILERTAHGRLAPPRLNGQTLFDNYELPIKQIGVMILLVVLGVGIMLVFAPAIFVYLVVVIALFPAMILTLALERSITAALNPVTLFGIAFRIGWPYFAVLGLLLLLNGGSGTLMTFFGQGVPLAARAFVGALAQNFFFFVMMNLTGYLIFQYHDRVGFQPEALVARDDGWGDLLDPVDEDVEAGNVAAAAERLRNFVHAHPEHAIRLRQKRHQVLKLGEDEDTLIDNAGKLLADLIDASRMREATEVYIDITDVDPALRPSREGDYEALMNMLVQRGEYRRAVRMANGFHKDFPRSASIPPLYLEVARVFSDYLQQPDKARQVADFLIKRFPDHPAAARAKALRDALAS